MYGMISNMRNCFSLIRKTDKDAGPVSLQKIDNEMCEHFNVVPDAKEYYYSWVDTIGLALSIGQAFDDIVKDCHADIGEYPADMGYYKRKLEIAKYLNEHCVPDAWIEIG
jgi:hypothetical protein